MPSIVRFMTEATTGEPNDFRTLQVERNGGITTVVLDRPHHKNAADLILWTELHELLVQIGRDDSHRVVVITGAGDAFCSGADLDPDDESPGAKRHWTRRMEEVNDVCLALNRLPQPTIARVNGVAAGAGMNLALACDLVVASERARFSEIFVKRGLSVDFGGSWILPRLIGLHRAKELVLLGDMLSATEVAALGLINRVVPHGELDGAVAEWADRLAAGPPIALAASKRLLNKGTESTLEEALAAEGAAQAINFTTRDTIEAILAFLEKRDPHFEGR